MPEERSLTSAVFPAMFCAACGAGFLFVVYMAFFVPKMKEEWDRLGMPLNSFEKGLCAVSNICCTFGFLLLPLLIIAGIIGLVRLVDAIKMSHQPDGAEQ